MSNARARTLRTSATEAEQYLWSLLRGLKVQGCHFRRRAPIGKYVADFACHRAKIVVELDGSQHGRPDQVQHDALRTQFLESRGYAVLRFWNSEIFEDAQAAVEKILLTAKARLTPHPVGRTKGPLDLS
jgi:very-short-patch-repair endonuclease